MQEIVDILSVYRIFNTFKYVWLKQLKTICKKTIDTKALSGQLTLKNNEKVFYCYKYFLF